MNDRYARYLASMQWRKKRDAVMKRSGGKCEMGCGRRATQVHHIKYPKKLGDEPITDLLAVCRQCHERGHGMIERNRNSLMVVFEGTEIQCTVEDDDHPLFKFDDIDAAIFPTKGIRFSAKQNRPRYKSQMREVRHWEDIKGIEYLTAPGVIRYAQILERLPESPPENVLWRFSDWVEDTVLAIRDGKVAIVEVSGDADMRHPELMQLMSWVASHQQRELKRVDKIEKAMPTNRDPEKCITVLQGCAELGYEATELPNSPDRRTLDQLVGTRLANAVRAGKIEVGEKQEIRLPDSSTITSVNTYARKWVHKVINDVKKG